SELRLRVRGAHGDEQGAVELRVRPVRHLRVVPRARVVSEREYYISQRQDSILERLRRAPGLRPVLAGPDTDPVAHTSDSAHAQRGRLVGSGGFLRADRHLSAPRTIRQGE